MYRIRTLCLVWLISITPAVGSEKYVIYIDGMDLSRSKANWDAARSGAPGTSYASRTDNYVEHSEIGTALLGGSTDTSQAIRILWSGDATDAQALKAAIEDTEIAIRNASKGAPPGREIIIATHSEGSVIAYDALVNLRNDPDVKAQGIATFLTLDSPLGQERLLVRNYLADVNGIPIPSQDQILGTSELNIKGNWVNAHAKDWLVGGDIDKATVNLHLYGSFVERTKKRLDGTVVYQHELAALDTSANARDSIADAVAFSNIMFEIQRTPLPQPSSPEHRAIAAEVELQSLTINRIESSTAMRMQSSQDLSRLTVAGVGAQTVGIAALPNKSVITQATVGAQMIPTSVTPIKQVSFSESFTGTADSVPDFPGSSGATTTFKDLTGDRSGFLPSNLSQQMSGRAEGFAGQVANDVRDRPVAAVVTGTSKVINGEVINANATMGFSSGFSDFKFGTGPFTIRRDGTSAGTFTGNTVSNGAETGVVSLNYSGSPR